MKLYEIIRQLVVSGYKIYNTKGIRRYLNRVNNWVRPLNDNNVIIVCNEEKRMNDYEMKQEKNNESNTIIIIVKELFSCQYENEYSSKEGDELTYS